MNILTAIKEKINSKKEQKIIKEIHDSFYGSVDDLLRYAEITKDLKPIDENHLNEVSKLKELGFIKAKKVKEVQLIKEENALNESINAKKELIKQDVLYFTNKYPLYKLITAEQIDTIISKYNLCLASVNFYRGDVPYKNLLEIENFKVDKEDIAYINKTNQFNSKTISYEEYTRYLIRIKEEKLNKENKKQAYKFDSFLSSASNMYDEYGLISRNLEQRNRTMINKTFFLQRADSLLENEPNPFQEKTFMIVAPEKDFDLPNTHHFIKGKIERIPVKDPIVLKEVIRKKRSYYLIVTAWGLEAGDDLVKNEKYN